ncbi:MAG TPA: hypothetical protein VFC99_21755 [Acidimicrobiia bacterium]|nr:hypothetical protein [Acidimicrobiia bacterium]
MVTPRIDLPTGEPNRFGLPDTTGLAPAITAARARIRKLAHRRGELDPVTTELVRIRNARHQTCYF